MHHSNMKDDPAEDTPARALSFLPILRSIMPDRRLTLSEAILIAELQADRLLKLVGQEDIPVPTSIVTDQPRIVIEPDPELPAKTASGCSDWDGNRGHWVISLNPEEPTTRQRFTIFHEYKHILDHYSRDILPAASPYEWSTRCGRC